jgi:hypothetical protein
VIPVANKENTTGANTVKELRNLFGLDAKQGFTLFSKDKGQQGQQGQKDQKGDSSKGMVATYAKSIESHMLRHYEMFVQTATHRVRESTINIMDIIYYHTFGDYRMVLVGNKIEFQYRTLKLEDEGQPVKGNVGNKSQYKEQILLGLTTSTPQTLWAHRTM